MFGGTKSVVISTVSWIGGKNPFLGWAYVGAAALFVLLGVAGTVRHVIKPRYMKLLWYMKPTNRCLGYQETRRHVAAVLESTWAHQRQRPIEVVPPLAIRYVFSLLLMSRGV
jgi:hypothetical protein